MITNSHSYGTPMPPLFRVIVVVPRECPRIFEQLELLIVQLGHDLGLPFSEKRANLSAMLTHSISPSPRGAADTEYPPDQAARSSRNGPLSQVPLLPVRDQAP
jgi:hypothetical protein